MFTTVVNLRDDSYDVYIGRGSKWGNPFYLEEDTLEERKRVIDLYKAYVFKSGLYQDIHELVGKRLGCYCKPKMCHGDHLAQLANEYAEVLLIREQQRQYKEKINVVVG